MRLFLFLAIFTLSAVSANATTTFIVEGKRPAACSQYEQYVAFLDRKAAERVAAAGYERFIIHQGSVGNTNHYSLTVEALPRGYSVSPGNRVMNVQSVLSGPHYCR
ncbi:hypothetical protein [uncultured Roseibium sp.]|uniref:hypothetical protein n=1 Tax=uncultured Roseibium sp. TaxID=1936171 RepID=UPI00262045B8|nr:hypothetical protein [uncultured Roseibium sp.]